MRRQPRFWSAPVAGDRPANAAAILFPGDLVVAVALEMLGWRTSGQPKACAASGQSPA